MQTTLVGEKRARPRSRWRRDSRRTPSTARAGTQCRCEDDSALSATEGGQAVSAFLAADRQAAADPTLTNMFGDQPFAAAADVASQDAVHAVVHAAASARSG